MLQAYAKTFRSWFLLKGKITAWTGCAPVLQISFFLQGLPGAASAAEAAEQGGRAGSGAVTRAALLGVRGGEARARLHGQPQHEERAEQPVPPVRESLQGFRSPTTSVTGALSLKLWALICSPSGHSKLPLQLGAYT